MKPSKTATGAAHQRVGMVHWNGNLLCAIDTETTGLNYKHNEIVEFSVLPLDHDFDVHPLFPPFTIWLRPEHIGENDALPSGLSKEKLAQYTINGHDKYTGADLFTQWFESLKLGQNKKIIPLGHNYTFDKDFIREWLGTKNYEYVFHGFERDTMSIDKMLSDVRRDTIMLSNFLNDHAEFNMENLVPHPKHSLGSLCTKYGVQLMDAHTANADALATAQLYKQMLRCISFNP